MNKNNITPLAIFFFLFLGVFSLTAEAGLGDSIGGAVNDIQSKFQDAISIWVTPLQEIAKWLLLSLAVISYSWAAAFMLLRGADIQEFLVEFVRMIMFTGFFYWLISEAPSLTGSIVNGWIYVAGQAGGISTSPNVGGIIQTGFNTAEAIFKADESLVPLVGALGAIFITSIYSLIAAKVLFIILEMYTVTASGVILLGFGGNQWTGDYARRYITYTMAVGMKLFVMYLIVATGNSLITSLVNGIDPKSAPDIFSLIGILIVFQVLVWQIPDTVQALLSGASIGSAAGSAASAAKSAAGALAGAAVGAAGGALAVREALKASEGMPGSGGGFQYKAMNAMSNLAESGAEVLGNRIMGDYNASSGSLGGSMAQHMRQKRTGGSGLYGGTSASNDQIGGSSGGSGGSIGAGGSTTKGNDAGGEGADSSKQTVAEYAENAGYTSPAAGDSGTDAGDSGDVSGADDPATRYRSPAVDLTKGGLPSYESSQGSTANTAKNESGAGMGSSGGGSTVRGAAGVGSAGGDQGAGASAAESAGGVSAASYLRSESPMEVGSAGSSGSFVDSGVQPTNASDSSMQGSVASGSGSGAQHLKGGSSAADIGSAGVLSGGSSVSLQTDADDPVIGGAATGGAVIGAALSTTNASDFDEVIPASVVPAAAKVLKDAGTAAVNPGAPVAPADKSSQDINKLKGVIRDTDAVGDGDADGKQ